MTGEFRTVCPVVYIVGIVSFQVLVQILFTCVELKYSLLQCRLNHRPNGPLATCCMRPIDATGFFYC